MIGYVTFKEIIFGLELMILHGKHVQTYKIETLTNTHQSTEKWNFLALNKKKDTAVFGKGNPGGLPLSPLRGICTGQVSPPQRIFYEKTESANAWGSELRRGSAPLELADA